MPTLTQEITQTIVERGELSKAGIQPMLGHERFREVRKTARGAAR